MSTILHTHGQRRVIRSGVKINGHHYGSSLLHDGETVVVRLDLDHRGRTHVFSADQTKYLGEAICPELCVEGATS